MHSNIGNVFGNKTFSVGGGKHVWREVRHRFPSGGTITNYADFIASGETSGVIPAGTPVQFDDSTKVITALTSTALASAESVSGLLQDDVYISSNEDTTNIACTGTVVYAGEIYAWAFSSADLTKLKTLAPAEIHFVN